MSYENNVAKFILTETTEQTEGSYTCRAINDAGSVETNCKVTVQGMLMLLCKLGFKLIESLLWKEKPIVTF